VTELDNNDAERIAAIHDRLSNLRSDAATARAPIPAAQRHLPAIAGGGVAVMIAALFGPWIVGDTPEVFLGVAEAHAFTLIGLVAVASAVLWAIEDSTLGSAKSRTHRWILAIGLVGAGMVATATVMSFGDPLAVSTSEPRIGGFQWLEFGGIALAVSGLAGWFDSIRPRQRW
jgi:hypothetical protein